MTVANVLLTGIFVFLVGFFIREAVLEIIKDKEIQ